MCVILDIKPGVDFPHDKLELACDINPHGYGVAFVDKGYIRVRRSIAKNDPKEIADLLHSLRKKRRWVHLRYATVGDVTMANNHPFVVTQDRRGIQLAMMHNGTFSDYRPGKDDKASDTSVFNSQFLQPLAQRAAAFNRGGIMADHFSRMQLRKEIGQWGVVVLFDNHGNCFRFNETRGKDYGDFWASNEYSFDKNHSRSSSRTVYRNQNGPWWEREADDLPWGVDRHDDDIAIRAWDKDLPSGTKTVLPATTVVMDTVVSLSKHMQEAHDFIEQVGKK